MRRDWGSKRGRWLSLLVAGFIGYLAGDWHAVAVRSAGLSPSQNVALRFPEAKPEGAVADAAADAPTGAVSAVLKDAQLALLSPQPMVPVTIPHPAEPQQAAASPAPEPVSAPAPTPAPQPAVEPATAAHARAELKQSALEGSAARHASRPGFLFNDAQIASIKERLRLTADQERMWPAVEAALRNIAYAKTRADHRRSAPANVEAASLDADSAEVQGLKSAAIPLIMSFNDEQKNEVRSLAHVMGLDKLAAEF